MKYYGVYHIYCTNDWKNIFECQLDLLKTSRILNRINKLFITINYTLDSDLDYIKNKISDLNIEIIYSDKKNEFEFPALDFIKSLCDNEECYIFYFHTKGSSICESTKHYYTAAMYRDNPKIGEDNTIELKHLKDCVNDWREYMEYFTIQNFEKCLEALNEYDACGVNLTTQPMKHFSGNFWWSKSSHIKKLPKISSLNKSYRWNAEFWIGMGLGNLYSFHNNHAGYTKRINKETYQI
jgi:hypothetical protein